MKKFKLFTFILTSLLLVVACSEKNEEQATNQKASQTVQRTYDPIVYSKGQKLFQQNCAVCHGKQGEGAPNWRQMDGDGKFPAPPLNGTGHTWHHSTSVLTQIIKDGTGKLGGNMPAWKDKLNDKDIESILTWIKAQWPDEIYQAWYTNFHSK